MDARRHSRIVRHRYDRPRRGQLALAQVRRHRERHAAVRGPQVSDALGLVAPDGRKLLPWQSRVQRPTEDVSLYFIDDRTTTPFLQGPANKTSASFSPDSRCSVAGLFPTNRVGRRSSFKPMRRTRPQPGFRRRRRTAPVWGRGRARAVLREGRHPCSLRRSRSAKRSAAARVERLFSGPYTFDVLAVNYLQTVNYDVAPDGQRFLVVPATQFPAPISWSWR